jgi:LPS-assembly protein
LLRLRYLLAIVPLSASFSSMAAENWGLCSVPSFQFIEAEGLAEGETRLEANQIASENAETMRLLGDVSVVRKRQQLSADEVLLQKQSEHITAIGNALLQQPGNRAISERIEIDNLNDTAVIERPHFELSGRHARGSAEKIVKLDNFRSRFEDLLYTACDPGDRFWHLRAAELEIDDQSGRGSSTHTTLYLQGFPFIYLPYFQFPIDDRRLSGLLSPTYGYSRDDGTTLLLPIYWNQAPNYDMTITPAWFKKRGLQLNTENRYLFESGRGQLDLSWLDDKKLDQTRWFQQWRHQSSLPWDINADLQLAEVSDGKVFDDFENVAPEYNDISHLERRVRFGRSGEVWSGELLWQDYQTLDPTTAIGGRPYRRLPSLKIDARPASWWGGLRTPLSAEITAFDRDDSVTGNRAHLVGSAVWTAEDSWYFFEPQLDLAVTDYRLENTTGDETLHRALPTLGIDSGLIFERDAGSGGKWLQTLEPRLFFLHTPFEDQDEFPNFDSALKGSTYDNLFSSNRFNGADRIGDASQVTLGLASQLYSSDDGTRLMRVRAGQIHYFEDRRVSLNGTVDDAERSDVIGELDLWPNPRTRVSARLVRDQQTGEYDDRELSMSYRNAGLVANLGYYFTEEELEQAVASLVYPLNERWTLVAKYHQSLRFEKPVDHLLGFGYESCCWGFKMLYGESGDEDEDFAETDYRVYFELTLKGLTDAGQDIDLQLGESIPGYQSAF